MPSLRSIDSELKYNAYLAQIPAGGACALCEKESLKTFSNWKIVENSFPYDLVSETHHMLIPMRHVHEAHLNDEELAELQSLKLHSLGEEYDYILETTFKNRSVPDHYHLHLLVAIPARDKYLPTAS